MGIKTNFVLWNVKFSSTYKHDRTDKRKQIKTIQ